MTYAPDGAGVGPAGQRWYTGLGSLAPASNSFAMQLYESTGGLFDDDTVTPTTVVVGSGTLMFDGCTAKLSFTFTGGSNNGASGTTAFDSADPSGAGCWDY